MNIVTRATFLVCLSLLIVMGVRAYPLNQDQKEETGSITGTVTIKGKAVAGIVVIAEPYDPNPARRAEQIMSQSRLVKAATDLDGTYRLTGVAAGRYKVLPYSPEFVIRTDDVSSLSGSIVSVGEGETIEGMDFALSLGGVITGRVTDAEGRPLIGESITLKQIDKAGNSRPVSLSSLRLIFTDDRGVYRIFGLPDGNYIVGAGGDRTTTVNPFLKRHSSLTFFPGFKEEQRARIIEVSAGSEVSDIDIKLGQPNKTYRASGRVVDAETGRPIPDRIIYYNPNPNSSATSNAAQPSSGGFSYTDSHGEFLFDSVLPGRYSLTSYSTAETEFYNDPTFFEVSNADVSGIEIKLYRGISISGIASVESTSGAEPLVGASQLVLMAFIRGPNMAPNNIVRGQMESDGSFRLAGIKPGRVQILVTDPTHSTQLQLLRIQYNGVEQNEGIEVRAGDQISGVQLVLGKASGVVRGQVSVQGGQLTGGERLLVIAQKIGSIPPLGSYEADVDANGRFILGNLLPGNYELRLSLNSASQPPPGFPAAKQIVTILNETPVDVTLVLDLRSKDK